MNNSKPSWPSLTSRVELANGIGEDDSRSPALALIREYCKKEIQQGQKRPVYLVSKVLRDA